MFRLWLKSLQTVLLTVFPTNTNNLTNKQATIDWMKSTSMKQSNIDYKMERIIQFSHLLVFTSYWCRPLRLWWHYNSSSSCDHHRIVVHFVDVNRRYKFSWYPWYNESQVEEMNQHGKFVRYQLLLHSFSIAKCDLWWCWCSPTNS